MATTVTVTATSTHSAGTGTTITVGPTAASATPYANTGTTSSPLGFFIGLAALLVVILVLTAVCIWCCVRRGRRRSAARRHNQMELTRPGGPAAQGMVPSQYQARREVAEGSTQPLNDGTMLQEHYAPTNIRQARQSTLPQEHYAPAAKTPQVIARPYPS